jgi:hypothetical protein
MKAVVMFASLCVGLAPALVASGEITDYSAPKQQFSYRNQSGAVQVSGVVYNDGSISFITITPTLRGLEFVVGAHDHKRTLVARDAQHEYVFVEE